MKTAVRISGCVFFLFSLLFLVYEKIYADNSWKNCYGIAWRDTPENSIKYAKHMGYDYIAAKSWSPDTYKTNPACAGLRFFIIDPHTNSPIYADLPNRSALGTNVEGGKVVDTSKTYTAEQQSWYNQRMVWKSTDPFPYNLATGHFADATGTKFTAMWDVQQQAVIDELIGKILQLFKSYENPSLPFTFAGYGVDVPMLSGDFSYINSSGVRTRATLALWTGSDSGLLHDNITHEYPTYTEGMAAFYKQLNARMRQEFPGAKWIIEPARVYDASGYVSGDEWIASIKGRADKNELTPDVILQEGNTTDFVDNSNNFTSGVNITKDSVGCSQNSKVEEDANRLIAAKAAMSGAWYTWFGRFGGTGTMPNFQSITDVYLRLKLVRCIPNWENLNNVPLTYRSWDGNVYQSPKSYISNDVMYSRHPKTGKLFAVFLTTNGTIKLNSWETVSSIQSVDGYFMESGDGSADFDIVDKTVRLKSGVSIAVDSGNGQVKGNGYIFTLLSTSGVPVVLTGPVTNATWGSATLNGLVNPNGLSTMVWFEYGTMTGAYGGRTTAQEVVGTTDLEVGINVSGLSSGKTYYYRIVGQNTEGLVYGSERAFITGDTTPPVSSIKINNDSQYTKVAGVTLNLSATDNVGVTGYYISTSPTVPLATATGWIAVTSTATFSLNKSYTVSSGTGTKTVYFWCKDAAGNVSNVVSDSIIYDATTPVVTINNPTLNTTFSTRSATIKLGGSASDTTSGISKVTWVNNKGGSGIAIGTTSWTTGDINLLSGSNIITVTATDGAGNTRTDTITVSLLGILPPDALQAFYSLDEGSGAIATDASGNGNNGAIYGAIWTTGKINNGLKFNGTSNYVATPRMNYDEVSVSAWIYKSAKDTTNADSILSALRWDSTVQIQEGFELRFLPTAPDIIEFVLVTKNLSGTKTTKIARSSMSNSVGSWFHVAGVYSKTTGEQKLYVNGQAVNLQLHPVGNVVAPLAYYPDMRLGFSRFSNGYFNGVIDEVRIYKGSLSDKEVQDLYNEQGMAPLFPAFAGSIIINNGNSYTNSINVALNLSAANSAGVTGYYLSTNSTTPLATATGWKTVTSTTNYNASVPYALSSGDGNKTVYAWFKDASGKVSGTASDSIGLDTTAPAVSIISPTSNAIYTTTTNTINLGGNATDSGSGVINVVWSSDKGGSGTASGTANWAISGINLTSGSNVITVTAKDGAGNTGTAAITVQYEVGLVVATETVSNIRLDSATLNGTVNPGGSSTTVWFEYDTTSGIYGNATPAQDVSGTFNMVIRADITGLLEGKKYFYRAVAQNSSETKHGYEMSFTTLETAAPGGSIKINGGNAYTNSTTVMLTLSATDNIGVTGYYLSPANTPPTVTKVGWISVSSTPNFNANVSYTLSGEDGNKTVYVWFKDASGNVSGVASDSIMVDRRAPEIEIKSPTSDEKYVSPGTTVNLGGKAEDDESGVARVTWTNDRGGSGVASGTTSWTISGIKLMSGNNLITVTAIDGANNARKDTITVRPR